MELRDYLKLYWSQRGMILGLVVVGTGLSVAVAASRPVQYAASQSFAISRVNKETTTQYQYDGYYALQAADSFSQTVVSWFRTPSILLEVYGRAGLDPEIDSVSSLPGRFSVKKYSAQNIDVRFNERSEDRAKKLAAALPKVLEEKTTALNQTAEGKSLFAITGSMPVIAQAKPNLWLIGALAAIVSFGLAIFLAAARHYLRT